MSGESAVKVKGWHSSKDMRKPARCLFERPDEEMPGDVTFLVGDGSREAQQVFKCQKNTLAMVSCVFQAMFYGTFPQTHAIIKIPDVAPTAFQHMLCYAYGQPNIPLDVKCLDGALDTLYCAKKYFVEELERVCRDHIQLHVSVFGTDACLVFQRAPQLDEEGLTSLALARIALSASHIMEGDAFLCLSLDCLKRIVDCAHLNATEPQVYQGVRRWMKHNVGTVRRNALREVFVSLLYSIRFPLFTAIELTNGPIMDGILTDEETSSVLQCIRAAVPPTLPFLTTPRIPLPTPLRCYFHLLSAPRTTGDRPVRRLLLLYARPDLAPQCCTLLRHLVRSELHIRIASYDNEHADQPVQFPALLLTERNILAHSLTGACWFEWDVEGDTGLSLRIGVAAKPHTNHSAVFGFVLCLSDNQWVPFDAWDDQRIQGVADFYIGRR